MGLCEISNFIKQTKDTDIVEGTVIKSTGSWYRVVTKEGKHYDCRLRGKIKMEGSKATNPVAVGDRVFFEQEENNETGIIHNIQKRKNYIIRKATKSSRQTHVIASNIDQAVIIATLASPRTSTGFIDRLLVTCEAYRIPATIVFNKHDLINTDKARGELENITGIYTQVGYPCLHVSATKKFNLDGFVAMLRGKTSLVSGHSGVGKTALINAIEPGLNLRVASISTTHQKGKHTTTFAEMFKLSSGGSIIDTPGIKEFGLVDFEAWELSHYFPEMRRYFNRCRFDNCTHMNEPGCRVKEEVEKGNISPVRYDNYVRMLLNEETHK